MAELATLCAYERASKHSMSHMTLLTEQIAHLDEKLAVMEKRLLAEHLADPQSKLLAG